MTCKNLGKHDAHYHGYGDVYHCPVKKLCSIVETSLPGVTTCSEKCEGWTVDARVLQPKGNFAYFTGTNRPNECQMIETMIASARRAGVAEDFFIFAPYDCDGGIWRQIPADTPWKNHMAKVDFLLRLKDEPYDYFVWIDTDNYFVRHPGDLTDLLRDEPCWISMESDLASPDAKFKEWWGIFLKPETEKPLPQDILSPTLPEIWQEFGTKTLRNTNGGMWIVRKDAIDEFHERTWAAFNRLYSLGFHGIADEPALAIVGASWVSDPSQNLVDKHNHVWTCDWHGQFHGRLPDGKPWPQRDWLTQTDTGYANPAIVHAMRSKQAASSPDWQWVSAPPVEIKQPVGTRLHEILAECGITPPANCSCRSMQQKMDVWGVDGCEKIGLRSSRIWIVKRIRRRGSRWRQSQSVATCPQMVS